MSHGLVRELYWVDARDMLEHGLTKGDIDRSLLHAVSNGCKHEAKHLSLVHTKVGSANKAPEKVPAVGFENRNSVATEFEDDVEGR